MNRSFDRTSIASLRRGRQVSLGIFAALAVALSACAVPAPPAAERAGQPAPAQPAAPGEPIYIGVSGPLTGPNARYGVQWKKGFDLALEAINGKGGVRGRKLEYIFEDSQSDPKQSVVVAQKFVADPRIVIELGDFSSPASMAASPIYQRAGLVQFGFTNSHPDFTKGGDYMWSNSATQEDLSPALAEFAHQTLGLNRLAVFYLNTDWGKATYDLFQKHAAKIGAQIVAAEAYLPDEKDFRSALVRARDANPDGIVLISYQADGAQIVQQLATTDLEVPVVGASSLHSPDFIRLGGAAAEGVFIRGQFSPEDTRPTVQAFVQAYRARYNEEPDFFAAHAYDTMNIVAALIELAGPDRKAIRDAFTQIRDVPSVIYGKVTFNPETRRVDKPQFVDLVVKDGKFVPWDGTARTGRQ
ncbi:MAG: ABC transporter substrate-binding protein [Anaerolineae bacterium]|nr:ABC transporter substrate-binding protein [Anaerolineae bacterium]